VAVEIRIRFRKNFISLLSGGRESAGVSYHSNREGPWPKELVLLNGDQGLLVVGEEIRDLLVQGRRIDFGHMEVNPLAVPIEEPAGR